MKKLLLLPILMALLIAAALGSGRFAAAIAEETLDYVQPLEAGALTEVDLDGGEVEYRFTAPSGSVYDLWLFPAGEDVPQVRSRLWRGDKLEAEGFEPVTKLTWSTANKKIATVGKTGLVTAKKAGKVKITVKTANGRKASIVVTVTP